ncbi:MAG: hypothetical protein FJX51_01940 [Alphaproteobacteria bacterium]|nr:hypothetical protein [Alphaproteobacteria bacterium]
MKIKCTDISFGPTPYEAVVTIGTVGGESEELVVDRDLVEDGRLDVAPVGRSNGHILVELPRESATGRWRVWVDSPDD